MQALLSLRHPRGSFHAAAGSMALQPRAHETPRCQVSRASLLYRWFHSLPVVPAETRVM